MSKAVSFRNFLLEDFEYHKELCPKIWDASEDAGGQFKIKPEIRETLMAIAKDFWNSLKLEVKVIEGLGTTIDVVLVNGLLKVQDTIVLQGFNGAIVTQVRALLTPHPMKEMRVKLNTSITKKSRELWESK